MFKTKGNVLTIDDFVKDCTKEQQEKLIGLKSPKIPWQYNQPLIKNGQGMPILEIEENGERSAYDPKLKIKLKGCAPDKSKKYTNLYYYFGDNNLIYHDDESWGVMTKDQVINELSGINFLNKNNLRNILKPFFVYKYNNESYCLAMESRENLRARDIFNEMSTDTFMQLRLFNQNLFRYIAPFKKAWLNDVEIAHYKKMYLKETKKTEKEAYAEFCSNYKKPMGIDKQIVSEYSNEFINLLLDMHFKGMFRNVVNSHQGNTIFSKDSLYICDLDASYFIKIPDSPNQEFIDNFYLSSVVEIMAGDFRYLTHVHTGDEKSSAARKIYSRYKNISRYFNKFQEEFTNRCNANNWPTPNYNVIENHNSFVDSIFRSVSNSFFLRHYPFSCGFENPYLIEDNL